MVSTRKYNKHVSQSIECFICCMHVELQTMSVIKSSSKYLGIISDANCTSQVKLAAFPSHGSGGLFAIMDGGRSPKVPHAIREMLEETVLNEMAIDYTNEEESIQDGDPLRYLTHTFLTLHR